MGGLRGQERYWMVPRLKVQNGPVQFGARDQYPQDIALKQNQRCGFLFRQFFWRTDVGGKKMRDAGWGMRKGLSKKYILFWNQLQLDAMGSCGAQISP